MTAKEGNANVASNCLLLALCLLPKVLSIHLRAHCWAELQLVQHKTCRSKLSPHSSQFRCDTNSEIASMANIYVMLYTVVQLQLW